MVLRINAALTAGLLALSISALSAQTLEERMDEVNERILAKHGVDVSGKISSEYFHSGASGPSVQDTSYSFETMQYTAFDLNMQFRPYDFIWAKADLRFYQDWQTFFATRSRILAARWLSVDGNIANMLAFNAGDFHQKYSKLTLWAPELDLVYEPMIFARAHKDLMDEQYLGDNNRVLQGFNLNFAHRFESPLNEVRLDGIASRVRRGEFLDKGGNQGFGIQKSDMDRYLFAGNGEAFLLSNLFVGGTFVNLVDDRDSYKLTVHSPAFLQALIDNGTPAPGDLSLNDQNSIVAHNLKVVSGRAGLDIGGFLGNPALTINLLGELAQSSDGNRMAWHFHTDTIGGPHAVAFDTTLPGQKGQAMDLEFTAGFQPEDSAFGINLTADYLNNEATFQNPLAQSPTFIATRIMNTENDNGGSTLYSTFDALYDGVYKFSPSTKTAAHQQAPMSKTSYTNGILSQEEIANFKGGDVPVQLLLPFGNATPNRSGITAELTGHWANTVHVTAMTGIMKELLGGFQDSLVVGIRSYNQTGAGIKVDVNRFMHRDLPFQISASYVDSKSTRASTAKDLVSPDIASSLLMAGFDFGFARKWALLGGYQQDKLTGFARISDTGQGADVNTHVYQYSLDQLQNHFRLGVQYALTANAYFLVSGGMISVDRKWANKGTAENTAGAIPARDFNEKFSQLLSQALIRVKF